MSGKPAGIAATPTPLEHGGTVVEYALASELRPLGPLALTGERLGTGTVSADDLDHLDVTPREQFMGSWFRCGDLGFIFGERGLGKTWFAMSLARRLAEGRDFGPWKTGGKHRVLYIDGEMPLDGIRQRNQVLREGSGTLDVLNHEWLFDKTGCVLNLSIKATQAVVLSKCIEAGYEVVFIDNLSCLFSGVAENDADAWEAVLGWLLEMRRQKIAVVIVHHANRTGQHMRGTSRREDAAFWVIRLDAVPDHSRESEGARFIARFTKSRQGTREETEPLDWQYEPTETGTRVTFRPLRTVEVFKQWVRDGLTSCSDIAEEMEMSRGAISKLAKRGQHEGWLKIIGREYQLTETT